MTTFILLFIDDVLDQLQQAEIFITLDLKNVFSMLKSIHRTLNLPLSLYIVVNNRT